MKLGISFALVLFFILFSQDAALCVKFASKSPLSSKGVQAREVSIGSLVADAIQKAMGADIALVPAGEIKEVDKDIPAGKVDSTDIISVLAYPEEPLVVVRLTGARIKQALEKSVGALPKNSLGFMQVSGLKFRFDPAAKAGMRVSDVQVGKTPLDMEKTYDVAMTRSLSKGALGYWRVWSEKDVVRKTDISVAKAVEDYLANIKSVDYSGADRILPKS